MIQFFLKFIYLFIFLGVLDLRFCARAFSSCGKRGPLLITVRGPLTVAASPVAEHRLQTRRLSSCGSRAQLLRGMWDLPRPGLEPVSPALAGRFLTTAPPGKPDSVFYILIYLCVYMCVCIYMYICVYIYILFHSFFHYRFLQGFEYSSLCYTVGPCSLSILYIVVFIC